MASLTREDRRRSIRPSTYQPPVAPARCWRRGAACTMACSESRIEFVAAARLQMKRFTMRTDAEIVGPKDARGRPYYRKVAGIPLPNQQNRTVEVSAMPTGRPGSAEPCGMDGRGPHLQESCLAGYDTTLVRDADEICKPNDRRLEELRDSRLESLRFTLLFPGASLPGQKRQRRVLGSRPCAGRAGARPRDPSDALNALRRAPGLRQIGQIRESCYERVGKI